MDVVISWLLILHESLGIYIMFVVLLLSGGEQFKLWTREWRDYKKAWILEAKCFLLVFV
jgi:hypothetical protein